MRTYKFTTMVVQPAYGSPSGRSGRRVQRFNAIALRPWCVLERDVSLEFLLSKFSVIVFRIVVSKGPLVVFGTDVRVWNVEGNREGDSESEDGEKGFHVEVTDDVEWLHRVVGLGDAWSS
jgi:hypothetical protein